MAIAAQRQDNGRRDVACRLLCALAMLVVAGQGVHAQTPAIPPQGQTPAVPPAQVFYAPAEALTATVARLGGDPRPQSTEGAYQFLDWLIYGGMGAAGACAWNVNSTPNNQQQACGPQFTPQVVAEHNTGIQRTLLYGVGDIRYYPSLDRVDVVATTAGVVHVWEIQRDLIFRVQAQGTENQQYSGFAANLAPNDAFLTTPLKYTQGYGSTSLQKYFGAFFTAVGGSIAGTAYQDIHDNLGNTIDEHFQNGTVSTTNGRIGYYITPITYTYVEPSYNWQRYVASSLNSEGYRFVGGIGFDRISLFKGEIYGGYATQWFANPLIATDSIPVVGGRLTWLPTPLVTLTLTADRAFGTSDFINTAGIVQPIIAPTTGLLPGSVTVNTSASLIGTWDFSRLLTFSATVSDNHLQYLTSTRQDDLLSFVGGVTFKVWQNLGLTVNYTHQHLYSNFPGAPFSTDFVSLGGSTKF
jgi:Putative beta-barrel porin 2